MDLTEHEAHMRTVDFEAIKPFSGAMQLRDVSVVRFSGESTAYLTGHIMQSLGQRIRFRAAPNLDEPPDGVVFVEFAYEVFDEGRLLIRADGIIVLLYGLQEEVFVDTGSPLACLAAELTGMYNGWPYLRELVNSTASRLGLTGIFLPTWKPPGQLPPAGEFLTLAAGEVPPEAAEE